MDWGRAKTILIVSFLLLNILLGYQLWNGRFGQAATASDDAYIAEETNKLLADKNIRITASIPKGAPKLKQLTGTISEKYRNAPRLNLPKPIKYTGGLLSKKTLRDVMNEAGVEKPDAYKLDSMLSKDGVYVLTQMAGNLPMFDVTLQLFAQKGEITAYKQAYVEVQSGGEQKEQTVISAYTAIRSLAEKYLLPGSQITDIELGYHGNRFDSETQYMLPFWRVMLSQGDPYYVQAFTGEVLEGPQDQKKQ